MAEQHESDVDDHDNPSIRHASRVYANYQSRLNQISFNANLAMDDKCKLQSCLKLKFYCYLVKYSSK